MFQKWMLILDEILEVLKLTRKPDAPAGFGALTQTAEETV